MKMFILGAIVATAVVAIMPVGTAIIFGAGLAIGYVVAKIA